MADCARYKGGRVVHVIKFVNRACGLVWEGLHGNARTNDHGFQKKRDSSCLAFLDAFCRVPPLYLPIYQPLAYYANRPRAIFQRPIVPRKRQGNTRVRQRPMKGYSVVADMPRVMLGKGKRVNTRGSEPLVTWGVQFNRETLLEDTKGFHGWITFTV